MTLPGGLQEPKQQTQKAIDTRIGGPNGPKPGSKKGRKFSTKKGHQWKMFTDNVLDVAVMPLAAIKDPKTRKEFVAKLQAQALVNPAGYFVKVLIPMMKLVPATYLHELFATMTDGVQTAEEAADTQVLIAMINSMKPGTDKLDAAALIEALKADIEDAEVIEDEEADTED